MRKTLICVILDKLCKQGLLSYVVIGHNNDKSDNNLLRSDCGGRKGRQKVLYKSPMFLKQGKELKNRPEQGG